MRQRYAQLGDDLRMTQAQLEAEAAKLKWQVTFNLDQGHGALAQYFETLGQLLREQSELEYLQGALERAKSLRSTGTIATEEYARTSTLLKGQQHKVEHLQKAVNELKTRADQARSLVNAGTAEPGLSDTGLDQLKPYLARIESIHAERARLQERLNQGRILAPTNGLIVKIQLFAGENCKGNDPMLLFLEEGSLQVTLYMPQKAAESLASGSEVNVMVDPYREPLACTVTRVGDQFEAAPENLKRHYSEGEKLLPVILQPKEECARWMALRVGEVVKLPYHMWRTSPEEPR
jgi:HlyD family secretion protein